MRVLQVITGLGVGGAEHQLRLVLPRLAGEPAVVTLTNPGPVATAIRAAGIPVHDLGMRGNRDLTAIPRLAAFIRSGRFDVVHTRLYRACVYGRVAARLAGVRAVVATEHSLGDGSSRHARRPPPSGRCTWPPNASGGSPSRCPRPSGSASSPGACRTAGSW